MFQGIVSTRRHYGSYGSEFRLDDEGHEMEKKLPQKRKSRGRPKKFEVSEGSQFTVNDWLYTWALKLHFLTPPV
jgi:hypothetical protein